MKAVTIMLAATIMSAGCTTMHSEQVKTGEQKVSSTDSSESPTSEYGRGTSPEPTKSYKMPVTALAKDDSEAILRALKNGNADAERVSIKDTAFIAVFDVNGNMSLVGALWHKNDLSQGKNITRESTTRFPLESSKPNHPVVQLVDPKPFIIGIYRGSHFAVITLPPQNGMAVGPLKIPLPPLHPCPPDWKAWTCQH